MEGTDRKKWPRKPPNIQKAPRKNADKELLREERACFSQPVTSDFFRAALSSAVIPRVPRKLWGLRPLLFFPGGQTLFLGYLEL